MRVSPRGSRHRACSPLGAEEAPGSLELSRDAPFRTWGWRGSLGSQQTRTCPGLWGPGVRRIGVGPCGEKRKRGPPAQPRGKGAPRSGSRPAGPPSLPQADGVLGSRPAEEEGTFISWTSRERVWRVHVAAPGAPCHHGLAPGGVPRGSCSTLSLLLAPHAPPSMPFSDSGPLPLPQDSGKAASRSPSRRGARSTQRGTEHTPPKRGQRGQCVTSSHGTPPVPAVRAGGRGPAGGPAGKWPV